MSFSFIARSTNPLSLLLLLLLFVFYFSSSFCHGTNSLRRGQFIRDGETITSQEERFALGFFGNSTHRYVGIWYNNVPTQSIIWVANSRIPLSGQNGTFALSNDGNLAILDGYGNSTWSTNSSNLSRNSTAILLDNGNLIVSVSENNIDPDEALWQSFDHPTDTYLPDMRIYMNIEEGVENRVFRSWTSPNDPSPGRYSLGVDPRGSPQIVIWEGQNRHWRSGHWNGLIFTGLASTRAVYLYGFRLLRDGNERLYFTYTLLNRSDLIRFRVISSGMEEQTRWNESTREWNLIQSQPQTECDIYNKCGAFGICNMLNSPICSCVQGFVPREIDQWNRGNWSGGCVRRSEVSCGQNRTLIGGGGVEIDQFLRIEGVKLPDFLDFVGAEGISDCAERCSRNCSCGAYAFVSGINCMMWSGELVDVQQFEESGNTLYVRIASSELGGRRRITNLVIAAIVVAGTVFLSISIWLIWRFRSKLKETLRLKKTDLPNPEAIRSGEFSTDFSRTNDFSLEGEQNAGPELAMYNFAFVAAATENFSNENKLGQGGFGAVYKGNLPGGQEIAVKRLSRKSGQGLEEFKNEITLIAKLQHRNLVRLLGCCIQGEEKMLLYEYMINKSLDSFIFDSSKKAELDWKKRFMIIEGIARGLIYLHRDSRLRIIHRDLKASNILLDQDMNPKISDFGMARIFGGNQNEANTNRVVGTYGYMAPEYAMEGLFSVKSDVYSFGVLLLEIISGRKNTSFRSPEFSNVIGYAWELWEGGRAMDLIDPTVVDSCCPDEALRCLHVAMLCVQDSASYRPTMASVVLMLGSESTTLPFPKQPTFRSMRRSVEEDLWKESHDNIVCSNGLTVTMIDGR